MAGYTHSAAFDDGFLEVSSIHTLHYEQYGKPDGKPVLFLHGGPGGQTSKSNTEFFDPSVYRVVLFDQRGAGRSTPCAEIRENTTSHLLSDIETLRNHLGVSKWHLVFGGSWGSTLGLLYAQKHPQLVGSMIIRGIFTVRKSELEWSRGPAGVAKLRPQQHEAFVNYLPEKDREDHFRAYYELLTSDDRQTRVSAARAWNTWDLSISELNVPESRFDMINDDDWSLAHAVLESHFFKHAAWLEEGQILNQENMDKIQHIPATIIQGEYDIITPPQTAWDLHKMWPKSQIYFIPNAGHSATEPGTYSKLVEVCDEYAQL